MPRVWICVVRLSRRRDWGMVGFELLERSFKGDVDGYIDARELGKRV